MELSTRVGLKEKKSGKLWPAHLLNARRRRVRLHTHTLDELVKCSHIVSGDEEGSLNRGPGN